ncbi:hypothetical protein CVT24_003793 [Panaeolus cyanescens]|uniref:F-box domain-containing protein n=1 Tax=Panaeolus cyanescens TaxID=181874 RepID=A0A409W839_9AGAR|nr:hypothetical protein CVT24_003793 [Panaeolus cyanescens]
MPFTDLPLELIEQIVSNLCHGTFADSKRARYYSILRQLSRYMNQLLLPVVFSQITLDFHVCHQISYDSQLAAIVSPNSPVARYARTLRILCLSPLQDRDEKDGRGAFMGEEWEKINKSIRISAKALSLIVEKNLGAMLSALKNIQNIVYHIHSNDPIQQMVGHIARMPRLNNLTIVLKDKIPAGIPQSFVNITGLHSLTLQSSARNRDISPASFSRLICQNPSLKSLVIRGFAAEANLDALFAYTPQNARTLQISHFDVDAVGLSASQNTLQNFRLLTSLDLTRLQKELDAPEFWQGLTTQATKLGIRTLRSYHVDYLLSYRGLKELCIEEVGGDLNPSRIFTDILPLHQGTLRKLTLGSYSSRAIFVTQEVIEELRRCQYLRNLSLVYNAQDIIIKDNNIPLLRDTIELARALPQLQSLSLGCCHPTDDNGNNGPSYGKMLMGGATNIMFSAIKKYQFNHNYLPGLSLHIPQAGVLCNFGPVGGRFGFIPIREEHPPDYAMRPPQFWTAYELRKASKVSFMKKTKRSPSPVDFSTVEVNLDAPPQLSPTLPAFNLLDLPLELIERICRAIPLFERRTRTDTVTLTKPTIGLDEWEYRIADIPKPRQDLSNLRLTCRFMNEVIEPIIFSDVVFHFTPQRESIDVLVGDLEKMAAGTHPVCKHAKSLYVVELAVMGLKQDGTMHEVTDAWRERLGPEDDAEEVERRFKRNVRLGETVNKYFREAIGNMKSLERVAIIVKDDVDASYTPHILKCMKGLPLLEEILFSGNQGKTHSLQFRDLVMDSFSHLRRVNIDGFSFEDPDKTITKYMADMFATANLWTHVRLNDFVGLALTDVLKALRPARELTCLDLQLYDMKISPLTPISYSQFSSLTSLSLISRDDPVDPNFWTGLRKEHIRLRRLRTDGLSFEFFEYLTSYNNLQHLQIDMYNTVPYFHPTEDELENLAAAALGAHSATLTSLHINVNPVLYRGMWFGKMFRNHVHMCPNLLEYGGTFLCNEFEKELQEFMEALVTGPRRWIEDLTVYCSHATMKVERPPDVSASPKIYQSALAARWLSSLEIQDSKNYPGRVEFRAISSTFKLQFVDGAYRYLLLPDCHPESFQSKHNHWLQNPYYFSPFFQQ